MSTGVAPPGLRRAAVAVGWAPLLGLVVLAALLGPGLPVWLRFLPLAASAVLLGMPHGAADLVAYPRTRDGRITSDGLLSVGGLYLLLGGGYALLWLVAPVPSAVLFVLLTWAHWGQGDVSALRDLYGCAHLRDPTQQALTALLRGGLPMLVPLVASPGRYRAVLESFVAPFGGTVGDWWLFAPGTRLAVGLGLATLTAVTLARGYRLVVATDGQAALDAWRLDAAESGLLWLVFLTVPPVLAVGAYFCCWHSFRHVVRVLRLHGPSAASLARGRWTRPLGRFALETAAPTAAALGLFLGLWLAVPAQPTGIAGLLGLYLVGIAALTLPHVVVVTVMDRADGLWGVDPSGQIAGP